MAEQIGYFFPCLEERYVNLSVERDIWKCEKRFGGGSCWGFEWNVSPFLCLSPILFILCLIQIIILMHPLDLREQRFREKPFSEQLRQGEICTQAGKGCGDTSRLQVNVPSQPSLKCLGGWGSPSAVA